MQLAIMAPQIKPRKDTQEINIFLNLAKVLNLNKKIGFETFFWLSLPVVSNFL